MNSSGDVGLLPSAAGISSSPSFSASSSPFSKMIINPSTNNDSQSSPAGEGFNVKWTKVNDASTSQSIQPRPRHGHRAISYGNLMLVFGGGNEGIVEELHVFDASTHEWFQPSVKGEVPPGCAAFGMVLDGCRMLMYGGMTEYGRYSSDLYELNIPKWEWKKLKPKGPRSCEPPCARLGHSFTLIRDQVYLFGGLANDSEDLKINIPRYMNDIYVLQARLNNEHGIWDVPVTFGNPPGPRESHSAVAYISKDNRFSKLIVYGGMSGCRLGDLYVLDVDTLMWCKPEVKGATPSPRSLHTATLVGEKMYVFGGWVPMMVEELKTSEKEWKCTNSLACLNVETLQWENLHQDILDDKVPRARAGHSAVVINTRIYIWSGRDGYRKAWNNQVCCKDLWQLEVQKPGDPGKVQLLRAGTNWLEVGWNPVPGADSYILQCVAFDVPSEPMFQSDPNSAQPPLQSLAAAGYAPAPPIMTPVPTSKPSKSAVPPVKVEVGLPGAAAAVSAASASQPAGTISINMPMMPQGGLVTNTSVSVQGSMVGVSSAQLPSSATADPASTSVITLSMPSLAPSTPMSMSEVAAAVSSAASVSPAVLPTASSLYTLSANVAGTASSMLASKSVARPAMAPVTSASLQSAGRGVLRLQTPVQLSGPRTATVVTSIPPGATVLKATQVMGSSSSEAASVQMSGMHTLAAAAAATQKIQTPGPATGLAKIMAQAGVGQVYSQVKMANMSGVLPPGVRLSAPVTTTGKPGEMKQIIVKNPGQPGGGNQIYTVVKTSQGMALANFQGSKVIQGKPGGMTTTNVVPASSIQGSPQKTANIIKWVASPGSGLPSVSKPNIISTNQPLLSLAGQGSSGIQQRPTYIISKPSTTMANRSQTPQYVVVTQASAIRSIQGMAASSLAGGQTITLPTSVATAGGAPQGVKMIVMPSGSGPPTVAGQSVKIITPGGMQTASASKTVTLGGPKPTQYITSGGQIVTLPPGLLQAGGQQQISIGGKQVTLQMAGGQKLAILSNSGNQLIHTSNQDPNKPKFVMVGAGQKATIPTSTAMRLSIGGVLQPDSTSTIGDGVVGVAAEGLVEMAGGGGIGDQSGGDQQNGMDGDQGGLKGGSMYGPWSTFDFSSPSWMKLKGGGGNPYERLLHPSGNRTIPIYSFNTKFSWKDAINFGLKGGADGDDGEVQSSQESQSTPLSQASTEVLASTQEDLSQVEQQQADSTTSGIATTEASQETQVATGSQSAAVAETSATELSADSSSVPMQVDSETTDEQKENSSNMDVEMQGTTGNESVADSAVTPLTNTAAAVSENNNVAPSDDVMQLPSTSESATSEAVLGTGDASTLKFNPTTFELQMPISTTSAESENMQNEAVLVLPPATSSQEQTSSQLPVVTLSQGQQPTVSVQFVSQPPNSQSIVSQQSITLDATPQPVTVTGPATTATPAPATTIPLMSSLGIPSPVTSSTSIAAPQPAATLNSGASSAGSQSPAVQPSAPVAVQSSSPSISSIPTTVTMSSPLLLPSSIPVSITSSGGSSPMVSGQSTPGMRLQSPSGASVKMGSPAQLPSTPSTASPSSSVSTNGTGSSQGTPIQARTPNVAPEEKVENWMDVLHTKNTSSIVRCYFTTNEKLSKLEPDIPVDKDLEFIKKKVELKPATAYKFRVAAINSCGRGPWGEVTAFKTCLPGFPGAPSSIKISKSGDGATIAWEPPLNTPGDILEYSVYLAVKPPANAPEPKPGVSNMSFVRVYCGPSNQCNVPTVSLSQALVDTSSKPAIIFRIAAKNDKGYGPATQVRWLQESALSGFSSAKTGILKRSSTFATTSAAKRGRND